MRINPYLSQQPHGAEGTREAKKELGKDEFLKILAAQFRGQNPLEPLSDTEFIAQMAQFSSLEQLQNISGKLDAFQEDLVWGQYLSLLGKEIQALTTKDDLVEGTVTGVSFKNGQFQLEINGREEDITAIVSVGVKAAPDPLEILQALIVSPEGDLPQDGEMDGEMDGEKEGGLGDA